MRPTPQSPAKNAIDLALRALDLQLRYRDPTAVDLERVSLWCDQLQLDAQHRNGASISSDVFTLYYLRDRVQASLNAETVSDYNHELGVLQESPSTTTHRARPVPPTGCRLPSTPR